MTSARWAILPMALFQWLVAWSLRYLPLHVTGTFTRLLLILSVALAIIAVPIAQILIYRSLTNNYDLRKDGYFLAVFFIEHIISLFIILLSASKRAGRL